MNKGLNVGEGSPGLAKKVQLVSPGRGDSTPEKTHMSTPERVEELELSQNSDNEVESKRSFGAAETVNMPTQRTVLTGHREKEDRIEVQD